MIAVVMREHSVMAAQRIGRDIKETMSPISVK
jgi:hypothetical protein